MRIRLQRKPRGIALVIVMLVIVTLAVLAGSFAAAMKVELRLAQHDSHETELEWLGRSGVELGRYVLSQSVNIPNEPWDSLNQKWAGGPMGTNEVLETISLVDNPLGNGSFSIRITDLERKFNINLMNEAIWQQVLSVMGVDLGEMSTIIDSYLDWMDVDENTHLSGTESDDYTSSPNPPFPPYVAKNGPIDDVAELMLIRGITPEMYWGSSGGDRRSRDRPQLGFVAPPGSIGGGNFGLVDLFTPISAGTININTAPSSVLQLIPGVDSALAQAIISHRSGLDGSEGNEDDMPFRTPGELINVPGMFPQMIQAMQGLLAVRSMTFEVEVEARIGEHVRRYVGVVRRNSNNPRDVQTLYFHWK